MLVLLFLSEELHAEPSGLDIILAELNRSREFLLGFLFLALRGNGFQSAYQTLVAETAIVMNHG